MTYDERIHMAHGELAGHLGVTGAKLASMVRASPRLVKLFQGCVPGLDQPRPIYDRAEAIEWAKHHGVEVVEQEEVELEIVPPQGWNLMERKTLNIKTHNPQLSINQQRAAELYPHSIRSAGFAVGNDLAYSPEFGRQR